MKLEMANTQEHIAYLRQKLQDLQSKDSEVGMSQFANLLYQHQSF